MRKHEKGEEPVLSAPYNKGYEVLPKENKIAFYYRDDNALIDDKLADMKVSVDINGTEYEMTYNAGNKRLSITITNWKADVHIIVIKSGMNIF